MVDEIGNELVFTCVDLEQKRNDEAKIKDQQTIAKLLRSRVRIHETLEDFLQIPPSSCELLGFLWIRIRLYST